MTFSSLCMFALLIYLSFFHSIVTLYGTTKSKYALQYVTVASFVMRNYLCNPNRKLLAVHLNYNSLSLHVWYISTGQIYL